MSTILTTNFRIHNAESFKEGFNELESTNIYTGIGKITPWDPVNLSFISEPIDDVQSNFQVWRNMISLKKIQPADVSHAIFRVDWTFGEKYSMYVDDNSILTYETSNEPFYVMTDEFHVYKCIFNNNGGPSEVKPTQTVTSGTIELSDGYVWKYMYTVSSPDAFKFMTTNYIPVKKLLVDPGSGCNSTTNQWDVQQAAVDGAIEYIYRHDWEEVLEGGQVILSRGLGDGYVNLTGNLTQITSEGAFVLDTGDTGENSEDMYKKATIYFKNPGEGLAETSFVIESYSGNSRIVTVEGGIQGKVTNPTAEFQIIPTVEVKGDGKDLEAVAVMNENQIHGVKILNGGSGYTKASVNFISPDKIPESRAAKFSVAISPPGGHGSNPVRELGGYFIIMNTKFRYNETGYLDKKLPTGNDFRQISLIRDPLMNETVEVDGVNVHPLATSDIFNQTKTLNVTVTSSNDFQADDVIIQSLGTNDSGEINVIASGVVVDVNITDSGTRDLRVSEISGTFVVGDGSGAISVDGGSNATASYINQILDEDLKPYSGEVLFVEQRSPIIRDDSQIEDIKIILEF